RRRKDQVKRGILIIGHGSRSLDAQRTFEKVIDMVRQKVSHRVVEGANMELAQPDIPTAVKKMIEKDIKEIFIVPYFLYAGIHIKEDIPEIVESLSQEYNSVTFRMGRPI